MIINGSFISSFLDIISKNIFCGFPFVENNSNTKKNFPIGDSNPGLLGESEIS